MYDPDCHELADHFLTDDKPAKMPSEVYEQNVARLAQEIQDCVELFCEYDKDWQSQLVCDWKLRNAVHTKTN